MLTRTIWRLSLLLALLPASLNARIVINEVFYHAPDDLEDLEYIELHNTGDEPVDLTGWAFTKGIKFRFENETQIAAKGFVVICRNRDRFKQFYDVPVAGVFDQKLSNNGERLQLSSPAGRLVDTVKYQDVPPWPAGADGFSGSLERISPDASGEDVSNWASSPLSRDRTKPAGTPGKVNVNYSAVLPPIISKVKFTPENPAPDQSIAVEAEVRDEAGVAAVNLRYRLAGPGYEKEESAITMKKVSDGLYAAAIPGQAKDQLIRFRIEATSMSGARRFFPAENEPRPALSSYVHEPIAAAAIPFGWIIDTTEAEFQAAQQRARSPGGRGFGFPPFNAEFAPAIDTNEVARLRARTMLQEGLDFPAAWFELTVNQETTIAQVQKLRTIIAAQTVQRDKLIDDSTDSSKVEEKLKTLPEVIKTFRGNLSEAVKPHLTETQGKAFGAWLEKPRPPSSGMIKSRINLEAAWYAVSVKAEIDETRFASVRTALRELNKERDALIEKAASSAQQQNGFREIREQADDLEQKLAAKLKPLLSPAQAKQFEDWRNGGNMFAAAPGGRGGPPDFGGPRGFGGGPGGRGGPPGGFGGFRGGFGRPAPGSTSSSSRSAFVYFDPAKGKLELFDFVEVLPRSGGQKVHFYKDKPLNKMTGINLIFESDQGVLVEPLAYEVYRKAGMAAEQSYHVRLWLDGQPVGYYLLVEQPNRAFLRNHKIPDDGNLYKILWYERGVVGQHEKKTHIHEGHDDVVALVDALQKSKGDEQWEIIKKNFDVEQVVNYFAVNTVLSHWDGFFNNYLAYHDTSKNGKWTMYPWDQDNTWGTTMGFGGGFYDMPITFGMNGDTPPGQRGQEGRGGGFGGGFGFGGGGAMWWRQPGYFSGPLLANAQFRKLFLARTKEILETIYTEEIFGPIINAVGERLKPEVKIRAEILKSNPDHALQDLERRLQGLRDHVKKRREFLLAQEEVKNAGKFSRDGLGPPATAREKK